MYKPPDCASDGEFPGDVLLRRPSLRLAGRLPQMCSNAGWCPPAASVVQARAAATRMATTLGERVGQTVGYRVRQEAK
eukprot:4983912-Pyramimonas_sp.AAC.1